MLKVLTKLKERIKWNKFPDNEPSEQGWYLCTVKAGCCQKYVMSLFWREDIKAWKDNIRQDVFNSYDVYGYGYDDKKVKLYTCDLCTRTNDVVAFRRLPKVMKEYGKH